MSLRQDSYWKIQPDRRPSDLGRGLAAEVHDPAWFIARQWLVGELQGSDGGTPADVTFVPISHRVTPIDGEPSLALHPVEASLEREACSFWTPGLRVRYGRAYERAVPRARRDPRLLCDDLPAPYQRLNQRVVDGQKAFARDASHEVFADVPASVDDHHRPSRFDHEASFPIQSPTSLRGLSGSPRSPRLTVTSRGDTVHWHGAQLSGTLPTPRSQRARRTRLEPLRFPGAPNPRWWQIEDGAADPTRLGADRSHFASLLLFELVSRVSHEWYGFVWQPEAGSLSGVRQVVVTDVFDQTHAVAPPDPDEWSIFQLSGTADPLLVPFVNATRPLAGDAPLDEVELSVDEQTGLVWARELRVNGRDLATPAHTESQGEADIIDLNEPPNRIYHPVRGANEPAHPYLPTGGMGSALEQGRLADLSGADPQWAPLAQATMIGAGQPHEIAAGTVTERGLKLDRRWVLARDVDGQPILWVRRRTTSLRTALPPLVRFDQVEVRNP